MLLHRKRGRDGKKGRIRGENLHGREIKEIKEDEE